MNQTKELKSHLTRKLIVNLIPQTWGNAEIFIGNGIGDPAPIKRISFHENLESGKRIIMLHEKEVEA